MKNSYKESIDRLAFNFGLDCLDDEKIKIWQRISIT